LYNFYHAGVDISYSIKIVLPHYMSLFILNCYWNHYCLHQSLL